MFLLWIIASTDGVVIKCEFKSVGWVVGPHYSCSQAKVASSENSTHLIDVLGEHELERNNSDVHGFEISDDVAFETMFKGIDKFFPNLVVILWQDGKIEKLFAEDFEPFPNLALLSFSENHLQSLDGNLFMHTRLLKWISFGYNKLNNVGSGILDGLESLMYANFRDNTCVDFIAQNKSQVEKLSALLRTDCTGTFPIDPPTILPTTTVIPEIKPEKCPATCVDRMELMELKFLKKIRDLERRLEEIENGNKTFR